MYRDRWHLRVSDVESWNECKRLCHEMNKLAASTGRTQNTFWTPTAGPWGEMIFESDYPDLATYERVEAEWGADPEWRKLSSRFVRLRTEGSTPYTELLETVDPAG